MIIDSSAVLAVVLQEPGYENVVGSIRSSRARGIGTPTLAETAIVMTNRRMENPVAVLAGLMHQLDVVGVPFGDDHWREAATASHLFGRGRHKAGLNFGDCLTYAVAKLANEPLLCTGKDFAATDLELA